MLPRVNEELCCQTGTAALTDSIYRLFFYLLCAILPRQINIFSGDQHMFREPKETVKALQEKLEELWRYL